MLFNPDVKDTCGKIPCRKILTVDSKNNTERVNLESYLEMYEGKNMKIMNVTSSGNITKTFNMKIRDVMDILDGAQKKLKKVCPKSRIFNISYTPLYLCDKNIAVKTVSPKRIRSKRKT